MNIYKEQSSLGSQRTRGSLKICITGGAGFIGRHLTNALLSHGHSVTVIGRFGTGNAASVNEGARIVKCDVRDLEAVKKFVDGFDAVFHLAAQVDVRVSLQNPEVDHEINFLGTKNVVEAAKQSNAKMIFTSSCAVYGDCEPPASEETEKNPQSGYGRNKLEAESLLGKGAFIARMFNVYGTGGNGFVNKVCKAAVSNKEVTIFGSGMQTRDYVHVDDVVAALMKGLQLSGTYNIGTGKETSALSVVHLAEAATGNKIKINFKPAIEGEIQRSFADISKIQKEGWQPKIALAEGIERLCGATNH